MTSKWGAEGDVGAAGKGGPGRGNSKHRGGAAGISWTPLRNSKEQEWLGQSAQGEDRAGTQGQGGEEMGRTKQSLGFTDAEAPAPHPADGVLVGSQFARFSGSLSAVAAAQSL